MVMAQGCVLNRSSGLSRSSGGGSSGGSLSSTISPQPLPSDSVLVRGHRWLFKVRLHHK